MELCRNAKRRANKRGLFFDLTTEHLLELWKVQKGKCLLTGIRFSHKKGIRGKAHHAAPSLDRIDPEKGYLPENVRLISYGLNCCLHDFGEDFFKAISENVVLGLKNQPVSLEGAEGLIGTQKWDASYRSGFNGTVTALIHSARKNAKEKRISCEITKEFVRELLSKQTTCSISGVTFDLTVGLKRANPLRPSLDRINPDVGYIPENVRLVCCAVNFGLNEFGEAVFRELCRLYLETSKTRHRWI